MNYKIGFIGGGNMAGAIIKGLIAKEVYLPEEIIASARTKDSVQALQKKYKIHTTLDNCEVITCSEMVVLAVKPHILPELLEGHRGYFKDAQLVVSIAAGITLKQLENWLPNTTCFRAMPNTPSAVGEGMTSIVSTDDSSYHKVEAVFNAIGKTMPIEERQIHAAIAVHGSSPAYAYMMLEAMGDAGVLLGLTRKQAYSMAAQTLVGAGKMLLESGLHPGELKDQVTSPMGTTIEAVAQLEKSQFRNAIIESMRVCAEKSMKMSGD